MPGKGNSLDYGARPLFEFRHNTQGPWCLKEELNWVVGTHYGQELFSENVLGCRLC